MPGARRAHEDDAHGRGRGQAAAHDVGHLLAARATACSRPAHGRRGRASGCRISRTSPYSCRSRSILRVHDGGAGERRVARRARAGRCPRSGRGPGRRSPPRAASGVISQADAAVAVLQVARRSRRARPGRAAGPPPPRRRRRPRRSRRRRRRRRARSAGRAAAARRPGGRTAQRARVVTFWRSAPPAGPDGRQGVGVVDDHGDRAAAAAGPWSGGRRAAISARAGSDGSGPS